MLTGIGASKMQISVVSLFPEMVKVIGKYGVVGKAFKNKLFTLQTENPRDYVEGDYKNVDDKPYGGGPGMVMKYKPIEAALEASKIGLPNDCLVVYLSPKGKPFDQAMAQKFAKMSSLILLAGRYEGIDERLFESQIDEEISVGDYVLSGGEIAAMAVIDAVVRLLPGVLGDRESAVEDSFMKGLLDYPHYTRPEEIEGRKVPDVLLSGNHAEIFRWRRKQALGYSFLKRPDLLERMDLDLEQQTLLEEFLKEQI